MSAIARLLGRRTEAEALAARLPALVVEAQRIAETVAIGEHGRRRVGRGDAFWQFRDYDPGDAAQRIDWRRSARGDRLYVRETEWEAAQTAFLWRDGSGSMRWTGDRARPEKRHRAELLLLALAALLLRGGERVAVLGQAEPPTSGRTALTRLAATLTGEAAQADLPADTILPRHATAVLAGDFLGELAPLSARVGQLAARGAGGHIVQVLDPDELALPYDGRVRFEGLEGEAPSLIPRVDMVRDDYRAALADQRTQLAGIAKAAGWSLHLHTTDRPPLEPLVALHRALAPGGL